MTDLPQRLPDAEALCANLVGQLKGRVGPQVGMIGIATGGAWLAERLHGELGLHLPMGVLDASFYRDDFNQKGLKSQVKPSRVPFDVQGRHILLVDDVLYTGRTVRAALDALMDFGRPRSVQLAVLIDRGHRELPIRADYVGKNLPTAVTEAVQVRLLERDGRDEVVLVSAEER